MAARVAKVGKCDKKNAVGERRNLLRECWIECEKKKCAKMWCERDDKCCSFYFLLSFWFLVSFGEKTILRLYGGAV